MHAPTRLKRFLGNQVEIGKNMYGRMASRSVLVGKRKIRIGIIFTVVGSALAAFIITAVCFLSWKAFVLKSHNPTKYEVQTSMQALLEEHITLLSTAVRSLVYNQSDYQVIIKSLDANSYKISERIGSIYGTKEGEKFLLLWKSQIASYMQYAKDAKDGYRGNAQKQLPTITSFPDKFATFFVTINPKTQKSALKSAMSHYVAQMKTIIDTYVSKDYVTSYEQQSLAIKHVDAIAAILVTDMAAGRPNNFR